ncbi:interleukin-17C [Etheostoma spectabile]|uniref:interleukin-17C n=1 Tax=Etheostoma spectabile TaxID=54343 RepID=UPI0013AF4C61|nr:interleukin-17C-like [Etheostoma spectabile]
MTGWVSLRMISLGLLLFLSGPSSSAAAQGRSRCTSADQLDKRANKFLERHRSALSSTPEPQGASTCAEAAEVMRGDVNRRSLSPWTYNITRDDSRFPHEIPVAVCLCNGCIINQREDTSYNSVPVMARMMVLRKTACPQDTTKYAVKKVFENIAVGCTCVVPKSSI